MFTFITKWKSCVDTFVSYLIFVKFREKVSPLVKFKAVAAAVSVGVDVSVDASARVAANNLRDSRDSIIGITPLRLRARSER